ncbi:hypothetical protein RFI_02014 [Reticulomyxa filosa]|uniref:Cytochrome P450 n=1 Tax=Reticulomyxa filosa TaxID=46433 RepID=X6PA57_RETFI|nr:hypothetical protein RFI_02014 [Reticulomyxa filosa]|eukprot:ETO35061.1 hypothetical protein RFI_02014 [Reticulomyxa filosa]
MQGIYEKQLLAKSNADDLPCPDLRFLARTCLEETREIDREETIILSTYGSCVDHVENIIIGARLVYFIHFSMRDTFHNIFFEFVRIFQFPLHSVILQKLKKLNEMSQASGTDKWNELLELLKRKGVPAKATAALATLGALGALYWYVRPVPHDNIPMMDFPIHPIFGQLQTGELSAQFKEIHDSNCLYMASREEPVIAKAFPMRQFLVFLNDPEAIKFVFEDKFELFEKGEKTRELAGDILGNETKKKKKQMSSFSIEKNKIEWKLHRKIASRYFFNEQQIAKIKIKRMFSMRNLKDYMFECAVDGSKRVVKKLKEMKLQHEKQSKTEPFIVDIHDMLGRFTLDSFITMSFGHSLRIIEAAPEQHPFSVSFDYLSDSAMTRLVDVFWKMKRALNIGSEASRKTHVETIDKFINELLDMATTRTIYDENGNTRHDMLSLYLQYNPKWTRTELRDIALNLIIAARDTTRVLLTWFFFCMSTRPKILQKILDEINAIDSDEVTYEQVTHKLKKKEFMLPCFFWTFFFNHPFLTKIIWTDLNIYVQLPIIGKEKVGYIIRKGDLCVIHNYTIGRSTKFWGSDATEFDPTRWLKKPFTSLPAQLFPHFNVNPRLCLGRHFALMEAQVFLFHFFKTFKFYPVHNYANGKVPEYTTGLILNLKDGYPIILEAL